MESTFISIHDLSLDARLLYVSQSIEDVLGYKPDDVIGKSCWEYFHPEEIPFAQSIYGRSVQLDKAAVLHYCRIKDSNGQWIGCECVFTLVHDVLVASTSIYRRGPNSHQRAKDAPVIRQLFSSTPDIRYQMLQYISSNFDRPFCEPMLEPRAALFLNRFSRTLTIMYATNGLSEVLGIQSDQLMGRCFYYCISQECLRDAVHCLENAKANDSIAYLRFWYRDPRQDDYHIEADLMSDVQSIEDEEGGVNLTELIIDQDNEDAIMSDICKSHLTGDDVGLKDPTPLHTNAKSLSSSGTSSDYDTEGMAKHDVLFDKAEGQQSPSSSISTPVDHHSPDLPLAAYQSPAIELEAVVSCTSDGLVVVLRQARPLPSTYPVSRTSRGIYASPWAVKPILPNLSPPPPKATSPAWQQAEDPLMQCIRENTVFAWSLTGINGTFSRYSHGTPRGESQPDVMRIHQSNVTEINHAQDSSAIHVDGEPEQQHPEFHHNDHPFQSTSCFDHQ